MYCTWCKFFRKIGVLCEAQSELASCKMPLKFGKVEKCLIHSRNTISINVTVWGSCGTCFFPSYLEDPGCSAIRAES